MLTRDVTEETIARDFVDAAYHCEHHNFDLNGVSKFTLSTLPREHGVKVVITGEGSDEHFAGYPFFAAEYLQEPDWSQPDSMLTKNNILREQMQLSAGAEMKAIWKVSGGAVYDGPDKHALDDCNGSTTPGNLFAVNPTANLFAKWVHDQYNGTLDLRRTLMDSHTPEVRQKMKEKWHPLHTAMYLWNKSTFANILLACLADRTEMAHSVEARTPFLDHHLADYVNSLPPSVKLSYAPPEIGEGKSAEENHWWKSAGSALRSLSEKWILREAARPYITDELYRRKKLPFFAPTKWSADGPVHNMFKELLTREAVENLGFVDYAVVETALSVAFGANADPTSFRNLCHVGGWVALSQKFGIRRATVEDWPTFH
jgi:asparagine synthase (glutamine-hydrolysing)